MTLIGILAVLTMAATSVFLFASFISLEAAASDKHWVEYHETRDRMKIAGRIHIVAFIVLICLPLAA